VIAVMMIGGCPEPKSEGSVVRSCEACPACAASMVCFDGASLQCDGGPGREDRLYSPIACVRPDGTKHGQYKSFERIDQGWVETDGWYFEGRPIGHWVTVDATGRVVKVVSHEDGEPVVVLPRE
jgi:hypothetical protein